jgi:hypothetical protein
MYENLQKFLEGGGSLLYLGGNGIYEKVEYTADQTGVIFRNGVACGLREAALFRSLSMHERAILGVGTDACAMDGEPYEVLLQTHALFEGTLLRNGNEFGRMALNTGLGDFGRAASGLEVDASDGPGTNSAVPFSCGECTDASECPLPGVADLPAGLEILAKGKNSAAGSRTGAEMTYYRHHGGGIVFSVGSITFGGSLPVDPKIQQIVRNALSQANIFPGGLTLGDYANFYPCLDGPAVPVGQRCECGDHDGDNDVDLQDFQLFLLDFGDHY